jgi:SAM-dependent methyltransferase
MFWEPRTLDSKFYSGNKLNTLYVDFHYNLRKALPFQAKPFFEVFPLKSGALLDVGGGDGIFAGRAQAMGFDVSMIDFDERSVETARKKGVHKAFAYSLEDFVAFCNAQNRQFDIISFFEVLEHQEDLASFIANIKRLLKPGGWIVGSTPNRDRLFAHRQQKLDGQDTPPNHFFWWSKKSLLYFFNLNDFDMEIFRPKTDLDAAIGHMTTLLAGEAIKKMKARIIGTNAEEAHSEIGRGRQRVLSTLKYARYISLLPLGALLKLAIERSGGLSFYFQGHLRAAEEYMDKTA